MNYVKYLLLLIMISGCVVGAAVPKTEINYEAAGVTAFFLLILIDWDE